MDDPPAGGAAGGGGSPAATGPAGEIDLAKVNRVWPAVLDKLRETSPALAATFEGARPLALDEDSLKVGFPEDKTFNKRKAENPERREVVEEALEAVIGERLRPVYVSLDGGEGDGDPEPGKQLDEEALVERLKSEFDAEEVS